MQVALWRGVEWSQQNCGDVGIGFALIFWFFWIKPKEHRKKALLPPGFAALPYRLQR